MTLVQFLEVVRRRHNAESDSNWSDDEIYQLITNRINEALVVIGLLEDTDTTHTSVVGTQSYSYPTDCITIRQVDYDEERLKRITFRQWELYKSKSSGTVSGTPRFWFTWERKVYLVPVPAATDQITIYYYKEHPYIDGSSQTTIDIPSVLHTYLVPGVLADMFEKDLNDTAARRNEEKWLSVSIPRFQDFKSDEESDGSFSVVGDADSDMLTELGPV